MFFGTISLNVFFILVPVVLLELLSIPENIISGILSGIGVLMLLAPFLGEKMVHKYSFKKSLISLFLIMTITIFIYAFSRSILLSILILMVFYTMDIAYSVIFASAMQHSIPTKIRATMGSAVNTIWASANAISAGLVALNLIFFGLVGTMIFAGVLALCNTFLLYVMLNDGD